MAMTKLHYLGELFSAFLEPNDIIDKFLETGIFSQVGELIRDEKGTNTESRKERVHIFLQWFEGYDNENKYQELLDVLNADGSSYKWLVPMLEDCDTFDENFMKYLKRLQKPEKVKGILNLIFPALTVINAQDVMDQMHRFLTKADRKEISKVAENRGNCHAVNALLHKLIHKSPDSIEAFIEVIKTLNYAATETFRGSDEYATLAEALRDFFGNWEEIEEESVNIEEQPAAMAGRSACLAMSSAVSPLQQQEPMSISLKDIEPTDPHAPNKPVIDSTETDTPTTVSDPLKGLRDYEIELCKSALLGENVIICERTGSGKTMVAANIINEHLKENGSGKVVFFTPNGGLANQQFEKMKNFMPQRSEDKAIEILHGNMEDKVNRDFQRKIQVSQIIVMTPQILINCLKKKFVQSIFDFTMMVFDECHHARGSHPYSIILQKYLEEKSKDKNIQIIGLTATLGVGSAEDEEQAVANIFILLGILNATGGIDTVRIPENVDELNEKCPTAKEETVSIKHSEDDPLKQVITETANQILHLLNKIGAFTKLKIQNPKLYVNTLDKEFKNWCEMVRVAAEGHNDGKVDGGGKTEVSTLGRDTKSCADTLVHLVGATDLHKNCQLSDAVEDIEQYVQKHHVETQKQNTEVDKKLQQFLESTIEQLKKFEEETNNMLTMIEKRIDQKQKNDPDFRCMIMVSQRRYTTYLKHWVEESELLKELGAESYTGIGSGMSHKKQFERLASFREGTCKVLICTPDAAGEGIDNTNCSLVFTIDCVNDDIKKVQLRGRARKEGSEVVYIHFRDDEMFHDELSVDKLDLMVRATKKIQKMFKFNPTDYTKQLAEGRKAAITSLVEAEAERRRAPLPQPGNRNGLLCRKCSTLVCRTDQLIKLKGNHHTVDDSEFRSKYSRTVHKDRGEPLGKGKTHVNRIQCTTCGLDWGNEVAWKGYLVPIITITGFKIEDRFGTSETHRPNRWSHSRLKIPDRSREKGLYQRLFQKYADNKENVVDQ